jgi:predicted transposase YbfD/YdcC
MQGQNAWLSTPTLCVEDKSNEITAIPLLLKLLDLNNRIVSIDAMGCQRKIAKQIVEQDGNYLLNLKGNQGSLYDDVKTYFTNTNKSALSFWEEYDKDHGLIEHRKCYAIDNIKWLCDEHKWPGLKSIAMVESTRIIKDKVESDIRFYISSLPANPEQICKAARAHWVVENKCHWRLDVVFNEDGACIGNDNAAENMSIIRKWAMNILNQKKGKSSLKSLQSKACMSFNFAKSLLDDHFHV